MTLSKKLPLFFLLIAAAPLLVMGFIAFENGRHTIQKQTINHLFSTDILKKAELDGWLSEKTRHLEILANTHFMRTEFPFMLAGSNPNEPIWQARAQETENLYLKPFLHGGGYFELFVMEPKKGRIILSTDKTQKGKIKHYQAFFREGKTGTYIQNVYYSMSLGKPAMTVSTPLKDKDGNLIAVLAGRVDLSELSDIMGRRSSLLKTEDTYLVNKFNFFVTEPIFGKGFALKKSIHTEGVLLALKQESGHGFYEDYRGVPVMGVYEWIPEWELAMITEVDQNEAYAPIMGFRNTTALLCLAIACLASGLGLLLARTITRPLARLTDFAKAMGKGDLETEIIFSDKGEIGNLAKTLDQMRSELKESLVSRADLTREVQRRKATMADLERSNKELEQFAYVASHDLQEPLRMVASYTQLLAQRYENQLDEKAHKFIGYAVEGATRMQGLVNDLLQLSRIGTRGNPFEETDCHKVVQSVLKDLERSIEETGAQIQVEPLPTVMADSTQLGMLFQNLIANAIKFKGDSPPQVHISARQSDKEWVFQFRDNGIGIDPKYHERVFVIFQRLHERGQYEGSGIGLAITKKIVERHGGRIWIESAEGKGTSFFFTLPILNTTRSLSDG
ncbi:MAG: HAMP domain-containing protein [Desulfatibacillum sp.]|nr:HAMP domain-containing protein [Desulfatibacillum sp.]